MVDSYQLNSYPPKSSSHPTVAPVPRHGGHLGQHHGPVAALQEEYKQDFPHFTLNCASSVLYQVGEIMEI